MELHSSGMQQWCVEFTGSIQNISEGAMTLFKTAIACAVLLAALLFVLHKADARDQTGKWANSQYEEWFKSQHNSNGQICCDKSDGHFYDGDYTMNPDGSVTLQFKGKPHTLPKSMVLTGNNPTGHAIWWFLEFGDEHYDYCFAPGSLT